MDESKRYEMIECPQCKSAEIGEVTIIPPLTFTTNAHNCENCGYMIVESEWKVLPLLKCCKCWEVLKWEDREKPENWKYIGEFRIDTFERLCGFLIMEGFVIDNVTVEMDEPFF